MNDLTVYDYAVFMITLIIPLIVGFYHNMTGGKQSTVNEHMLADGKMTILPVAISLMTSFMSAITMLGLPAEVMFFSTQFAVINFGYVIGTPIACYLILPVFYEKKYLSLFQYLEVRFNRNLRILASTLFTLEMMLYMGIVLYAPALALSAVTNLPKWTTIFAIGIVCTIYCICGGIKAVLYNDIFQAALMFIGLLLIVFRGLYVVGGWSRMIEINWNNDRIQFFNISLSPFERHTIWTQLIGGTFLHLSVFSVNQTQIQRLLTLPTLKKSQQSLFVALAVTMALSCTTCLTGLVMYAYFQDCDPILSGKVKKSDQIVPLIMMELFNRFPPLPGLIVASIFAGAISSVASFVNSLAAVTLEEVIRPILLSKDQDVEKINDKTSLEQSSNERRAVIYSKILAIIYGLICLFIAYLCEKINRLLETCLALFGLAGGPMLAVFTLGISSKRCTANGAIFGFIISLLVGVIIGFGPILTGQNPIPLPRSTIGCEKENPFFFHSNVTTTSAPDDLYDSVQLKPIETNIYLYLFKISYMWICPITWSLTTVLALVYSYLLPDKNLLVDQSLLMPMLRIKNSQS